MEKNNMLPNLEKTVEPAASKAKLKGSSSTSSELDNEIFFYTGVDNDESLTLNQNIHEADEKVNQVRSDFERKYKVKCPKIPIKLHIQSPGGSVLAAFGSINYIKGAKNPVHTIVDGYAASAGTLLSVVGYERYIGEYSYMLIHQISSVHWGNMEQLKDEMANSELLMERIKEIYDEYAKIPRKKLEEILKHDLWWDAKKCLEYGLVDDII